ncbi:hypothetical protein R1flu_015037 [Riccia fluitans]|uniref:Glyoxalase/fosfomycin resistance/dioxygenase domain-containing protein n=1 Tax=Riccia fluitans TaxID=41844 RepID=A0ABD1YI70_9MARC
MEDDIFPAEEQLVSEWYTPSLNKSLDFLRALGFHVLREEPDHFAEVGWKSKSRLMVEQIDEFLVDENEKKFGYRGYSGNIRVLVPDVDYFYKKALEIEGAVILRELEDRYYGLRDFTVGGPFGLAIRFATPLAGSGIP